MRLGTAYWDAVDASGARQLLWLYDEIARMDSTNGLVVPTLSRVVLTARRRRTSDARAACEHVLDAFDHTIRFTPVA